MTCLVWEPVVGKEKSALGGRVKWRDWLRQGYVVAEEF
jgi:hypothetical protein